MPKAINAARATLSPADMILGRDVRSDNFTDIVENQNYDFAHTGLRLGGIIFDPVFYTTSTSYTTANSTSGGRNLDTWQAGGVLSRPVSVTGNTRWRIEIRVFGEDYDATFTVWNITDNTDVGTVVISNATTVTAWASGYFEFTTSDHAAGDVIAVSFDGAKTSSSANIFQVICTEHVITDTTMLPTG